MATGLYWIVKGRLAVARKPESVEMVQRWVRGEGVRAFVSLYNSQDIPEAIGGVEGLIRLLRSLGVDVIHYPVPSGRVPPIEEGLRIIRWIAERVEEGKPVAIGCRRAWGRSSALAAAYLVYTGTPPEKAARLVEEMAKAHGEDPGSEMQRLYPYRIAKYIAERGE